MRLILGVMGLGCVSFACAAGVPGFVPLVVEGEPGALVPGFALSADGTTAVGAVSQSGNATGFRWTIADGVQSLGTLSDGTTLTSASAVSSDGTFIVGTTSTDNGSLAYRWTAGSAQSIFELSPEAAASYGVDHESFGSAVSDDGAVAGSFLFNPPSVPFPAVRPEAFRWNGELAVLGGFIAVPAAITADGATVIAKSGSGRRGPTVLWTPLGEPVEVEELPFISGANDGSSDGSVVVGSLLPGAYRWTEAEGFSLLPGEAGSADNFFNSASAVSADGTVVVGSGTSGALIWTEREGTRSVASILTGTLGVDLQGWQLTDAVDVSADGLTILVRGFDAEGAFGTALVTIPAPGSAAGVGLMGIIATRRRR